MIIALTGAGISAPSGLPTYEERPELRDMFSLGYYNKHPEEANAALNELHDICQRCEPNDAHIALAQYGVPILTMNIDDLHERAGSEHLVHLHGELATGEIVLYGTSAPNYAVAFDWVSHCRYSDIVLIIGTSFTTGFAHQFFDFVRLHTDAQVFIINKNAQTAVREFLENHQEALSDWDEFQTREENLI